MSSPQQIAANFSNAQLSTGPVTPAGLAASSQNARKHGLYTAVSNLAAFEREAYEEILAEARDRWVPASSEEESLVADFVLAQLRLSRVRAMENGFITCAIDKLIDSGAVPRPQTPEEYGRLYGRVYYDDAAGARAFYKLHSIESRLLRQRDKLRARLDEIAKERSSRITANKSTSTKLASFSQKAADRFHVPSIGHDDLPRNASCPCGSGRKYKRCCGQDAKPHYNI